MYGKSELREDYQDIPRPIGAMARDLADGHHIPAHTHARAQLIYATRGAITVRTPYGSWSVPATRGVWIPAGSTHAMTCAGAVRLRTVYLDTASAPQMPALPTVVSISPLQRELIDEATRIPVHYDPDGRDGSVMALLLAELQPVPIPALHLPTPADPEIAGLCDAIEHDLGARWTAERAARQINCSVRTLHRRFTAATGLSLRHWVTQARLIQAVALLATETPVTTIAIELGYATPSAFTAMFRHTLGTTPSEYFAEAQP